MTLSSLAVLPEADRLFGSPGGLRSNRNSRRGARAADPTLLAVPASAPWKTLQDFVDDAKKAPRRNSLRLLRPYGTLHVAMDMFAASAGIKLLCMCRSAAPVRR